MLLLIIVLVLLIGGGGGYYGYSRWGSGGGLGSCRNDFADRPAAVSVWRIACVNAYDSGRRRS
jgi:hypothetical protein